MSELDRQIVDGQWRYVLGNSPPPLIEVTVPVSSAEILALNSSPKVIIPGVVGHGIFPMSFRFRARFGSTPYTVADQPFFFVANAIYQDPPVPQTITALLEAASGSDVQVSPWLRLPLALGFGDANAFALDNFDNQPLTLFARADPTDGDGTLDVTVLYELVDLA